MKNQYFGDVNDFRKYGLLRQLCGPEELAIGVCWMLTDSDGRQDGEFRNYLDAPRGYSPCDEELFNWLKGAIKQYDDRSVCQIEESLLLKRAVFHSDPLDDNIDKRDLYFAECIAKFRDCDVIFFDPDNGIEVGVQKGRPNSRKYVYWDELQRFYSAGSSLLIYQHFPRVARDAYIEQMACSVREKLGAQTVFAFRTAHVVFLLAAQARHVSGFRRLASSICDRWPPLRTSGTPQITGHEYPPPTES